MLDMVLSVEVVVSKMWKQWSRRKLRVVVRLVLMGVRVEVGLLNKGAI